MRRQRSFNLEDDLPSILDAVKTQCFTGVTILELNVRADFIEELIIDTMVAVWKERASIGANISVPAAIMRLAYSHGQRYFAKAQTQRASHFTVPFGESVLPYLVYGCGHSRQEIAEIMRVSTECVDLLLLVGSQNSSMNRFGAVRVKPIVWITKGTP